MSFTKRCHINFYYLHPSTGNDNILFLSWSIIYPSRHLRLQKRSLRTIFFKTSFLIHIVTIMCPEGNSTPSKEVTLHTCLNYLKKFYQIYYTKHPEGVWIKHMPLFFWEIIFNICPSHSTRIEVKPTNVIEFITLNIMEAFKQSSHNHMPLSF